MSTKKIVVVGVGALGSHLILLARGLDAQIVAIDFDRVERKNLLSQFHTKMGTGRNKAQAIQQAMGGLFGVRLEARPRKLEATNAEALLRGADLVVDCVDHGPTRLLIQETCARLEIPCLHGALAADGAYARVMWSEDFAIDGGGEGEPTCEDGEHLPFIAWVASWMAVCAQRFLADGARIGAHLHPGGMIPL